MSPEDVCLLLSVLGGLSIVYLGHCVTVVGSKINDEGENREEEDTKDRPTGGHDAHGAVRIVTLEGLIGCGKTTVIRGLRDSLSEGVRFIEEPVDEWEQVGMLKAAYEGSLNKGVFQHSVLMSLVAPLIEAINDPSVHTIVTERSPWTNRFVFALNNLKHMELDAYEYTFTKVIRSICTRPVLVDMVYLRVDISAARARMLRRGRESEASVDESYLSLLMKAHEELMDDPRLAFVDAVVPDGCSIHMKRVDASADKETVQMHVRSIIFEE